MRTTVLTLGLVALACLTQPARAQNQALDRETLARVQEWTRVILSELDMVQDDIAVEVRDERARRLLQKQVSDAIETTALFQASLRPNVPLDRLTKRHGDFDLQLEELEGAIERQGGKSRALSRSLRRLRYADDQLHYFLTLTYPKMYPVAHSASYQARALDRECKELTEVVASFPKDAAYGKTRDALDRYLKAVETFRARAARDAGIDVLQKEYAALDQSWDRVTRTVDELPQDAVYLVKPRAQRVDQVNERLGQILKVEGSRPRILLHDDATEAILAKMQGTWKLLSSFQNGKILPQSENTYHYVFQGNRWQILLNGKPYASGVIRVVRAKDDPWSVDLVTTEGTDKDTIYSCIMTVEKNELKHCYVPNGKRPNSFQTREGDERTSNVSERVRE